MRLGDLDTLKEKVDDYIKANPKVSGIFELMKIIIDTTPTIEERPTGEWTPVSERLPEELEPVNITWINHEPEPYYKGIKDKPFTATGVYFNGQWYWWSTLCTDMLAEYGHNYSDIIDDGIEITAWQPLPEPYEKGEEE